MRSLLAALFHRCDFPADPVIEDDRYWCCPGCKVVWVWTELEGGVGWARLG